MPVLFSSSTDVAERFFRALTLEPQGVRAAVQESVSSLAMAYKNMTPEISAKIEAVRLSPLNPKPFSA
jgi:hypothetical protein